MQTVGTRRWQRAAEDVAVRSITLVRDTTGTVAALRARRTRLALVTYADEATPSVALHLAELLRLNGDTVDYFRLWPMSGPASYDSARAALARAPVALFATNVKPIAWKGSIALPDSLAALITATGLGEAHRPGVVRQSVSAQSDADGEELSHRLERRAGRRAAAARALLGLSPIHGHLPIRIPPGYPVGWGIVMPDSSPPLPPPPQTTP